MVLPETVARVLSRRVRVLKRPPISLSHNKFLGPSSFQFATAVPTTFLHDDNFSFTQTAWFSTEQGSSDDSKLPDLDGRSSHQLEQLAGKYCRQFDPRQAQTILEKLEAQDETISDNLKTSVMDAWTKYQAAAIRKLNLSMETSNGDISRMEARSSMQDICHAAECTSDIVESMEKPSSHHYAAALKAWANACEASHAASLATADLVRGFPQRAQYLLSQQEPPTIESLNQVIRAWAYSSEHLRGTMAEEVFKKADDPNGETMKLTLRAWCSSRERRCAFVATGYFMRMMKMLELGRTDIDPSLDDYHILFDTWTTAR
jgi:hypothetical protein